MDGKLALNLPSAAEAAGVSIEIIRRAIDQGDLVPRYPSSRPVLLVKDLEAWLESRPTTRP